MRRGRRLSRPAEFWTKTKVVYCKEGKRKGKYPNVRFDFLGDCFRPRLVRRFRNNSLFRGFNPAVSPSAMKTMRETILLRLFVQFHLLSRSELHTPSVWLQSALIASLAVLLFGQLQSQRIHASFLLSRNICGRLCGCLWPLFQIFGRGVSEIRHSRLPVWTVAPGLPFAYVWLFVEARLVEEFFFRALLQSWLGCTS